MLLDKSTKKKFRRLLENIKKENGNKIFTTILTILLDKEKSKEDLAREIPALEKLSSDSSNPESSRALHILGFLCRDGLGVQLDKKRAAELFQLSAKKGLAGAQFSLGMCYLNGEGVEKDLKSAFEHFQLAAEQELAEAQLLLGDCYKDGEGVEQDLQDAFKYFKLAAEQELAEAQHSLGMCYLNGEGVEQDSKRAFEAFQLAAEQELADAQHSLGMCYLNGEGVEQDLKGAFEYCQLAADQGLAEAQLQLGKFYLEGVVIEKGLKRAVEYFELALTTSESVLATSHYFLGRCYQEGSDDLPQDLENAVAHYQLAMVQGHNSALSYLGLCYQNGQGVRKDLKQSVEYYRQATETGDPLGQQLLGKCYEQGNGVSKDIRRAALLFQAAGAECEDDLARLQKIPDVHIPNSDTAVVYYQDLLNPTKIKDIKSEAEVAAIYCNLGSCYQLGLKVPKNLEKAIECYKEAIKKSFPSALWDLLSCYREMISSDEELGKKRLLEFYKELETIPFPNPRMERERLLFLAYLYENGGPYFDQNLSLALEYYQKIQKIGDTEIYSQEKVRNYTPLLELEKTVSESIKDFDPLEDPAVKRISSVVTQYML